MYTFKYPLSSHILSSALSTLLLNSYLVFNFMYYPVQLKDFSFHLFQFSLLKYRVISLSFWICCLKMDIFVIFIWVFGNFSFWNFWFWHFILRFRWFRISLEVLDAFQCVTSSVHWKISYIILASFVDVFVEILSGPFIFCEPMDTSTFSALDSTLSCSLISVC